MQAFLSVRNELIAEQDVPDEIARTLQAHGWPPIAHTSKVAATQASAQHGESFFIRFASAPPPKLAPVGPGGDPMQAVLRVGPRLTSRRAQSTHRHWVRKARPLGTCRRRQPPQKSGRGTEWRQMRGGCGRRADARRGAGTCGGPCCQGCVTSLEARSGPSVTAQPIRVAVTGVKLRTLTHSAQARALHAQRVRAERAPRDRGCH